MFYSWSLEIVHLQTGEIRNIEYQGNITELFKYIKKLEQNQWELWNLKKNLKS